MKSVSSAINRTRFYMMKLSAFTCDCKISFPHWYYRRAEMYFSVGKCYSMKSQEFQRGISKLIYLEVKLGRKLKLSVQIVKFPMSFSIWNDCSVYAVPGCERSTDWTRNTVHLIASFSSFVHSFVCMWPRIFAPIWSIL